MRITIKATFIALLLATPAGSEFDESQVGVQISGPIYPGGLKYSADMNKIYFTGSFYEDGSTGGFAASDCFLGEMSLSDLTTKISPIRQGQNIPEACSALALTEVTSPKAFVLGTTELGGLGTAGLVTTRKQFGSVVEVLLDSSLTETGNVIVGDDMVTYPIDIIAEEDVGTTNLYIASMASRDTSTTADNAAIEEQEYPDLTSGGLRRFGSRYYLRFTKMTADSQILTDKTFTTSDESTVHPSGIAMVGEYLVIVGSTRGSAGDFPTSETSSQNAFVVRLGNVLGNSVVGEPVVSSAFIDTGTSQDDETATQVCGDPMDTDNFYVVGTSSSSSASMSPFVVKMSVNTLEPVWSIRLDSQNPSDSASDGAAAYGCMVDGDQVYVAGVVRGGASIVSPDDGPQASYGKDDLFVAKMEVSSGELLWARQFGTSENERLGKGGGIELDGAGNALLLGQTEGMFYESDTSEQRKLESGVADLIILSVSPNGEFRPPAGDPGDVAVDVEPAPTSPDPAPVPEPEPTSPDPPPVPEPTAPEPEPEPAPVSSPKKVKKAKSSPAFQDTAVLVAVIVVGAVLVLCCCCVICLRARRRADDRANQRKMLSIFKYLHVFDVDDIDIRRSPAGGYHGTYLNDLALGENGERTTSVSSGSGGSSVPGRPNRLLQHMGAHASVADDYMFISKRTLSKNENDDDDDDSQTLLSTRL